MKTALFSLLVLLTVPGCQTARVDPAASADCALCGTWVYARYTPVGNSGYNTYQRQNALVENQYGFIFRADGTLIDRKNAGWCGTPPITTSDSDGTWKQKGDTVYVNTSGWNGKQTLRFTYQFNTPDSLLIQFRY